LGITISSAGEEMVKDRLGPYKNDSNRLERCGKSDPQVCVGIDVSKAPLDVALRPMDDCWHVTNDEAGIAGLVERLRTV
jgi:hypothetical protein